MPWPATHVLIAEKAFIPHFSHLDKQAFIIGTCFPDIRYLAKIDRKLTHFNHLSLAEIKLLPAFYAGVQFHSLTDTAWNAYVHQHKARLFSVVPHNHAMLHTLKIFQDKYLYHRTGGWSQLAALFDLILPEEHEFGIPEDTLRAWHTVLASYLSKSPTYADLDMLQLTLPASLVEEIRRNYEAYEADPVLQEIMTGFYDATEGFLSSDTPNKLPTS